MQFLRIERALTRLAGESIPENSFYQTTGAFKTILRDNILSLIEIAERIADIIEGRLPNQMN